MNEPTNNDLAILWQVIRFFPKKIENCGYIYQNQVFILLRTTVVNPKNHPENCQVFLITAQH
jgi:hypothetical protein